MTEKVLYRGFFIGYVLLIYAFFPAFHLGISKEPTSLYSFLTQAYLSGHLYLQVPPLPELLNLTNPYDPNLNGALRLHDASLYQGRYYLYFGPLPVLIFYLPFKVLTGFYPSNDLVVFFFLSLAFLVGLSLLMKIKKSYFPAGSDWFLILTSLVWCLGNGVTILFSNPQVYEVASASAFCFMIFSCYFLYQFLQTALASGGGEYQITNSAQSTPHPSFGYLLQRSGEKAKKTKLTKDLFLFSLCLSLTTAGRPHFALVCLLLIPCILVFLWTKAPFKARRLSLSAALIFPALVIAFVLGGYNYLRFGSFLEFGHYWQLSCHNIMDLHSEWQDLSKIPRNLWYSFYFYFLKPFTFASKFPYFGLQVHNCYYTIDKDYYLESVAGALTTTPLLFFLLAFPSLLFKAIKEKKQSAFTWFLAFVSFIPLVNTLFLLLLPFAVQRYEMDFLPYWVFLALISFWFLEKRLAGRAWSLPIKVFFILSSSFSIVVGFNLFLAFWIFRDVA